MEHSHLTSRKQNYPLGINLCRVRISKGTYHIVLNYSIQISKRQPDRRETVLIRLRNIQLKFSKGHKWRCLHLRVLSRTQKHFQFSKKLHRLATKVESNFKASIYFLYFDIFTYIDIINVRQGEEYKGLIQKQVVNLLVKQILPSINW